MLKLTIIVAFLIAMAKGLLEPCDLVYRLQRPGSELCHLSLGHGSDEYFFNQLRQRIPHQPFWTTVLEIKEQCPEQSEELIRGLKYIWRGNTPRWIEMYANGDDGVLPLLLHLWHSWRRNRDIETIIGECPVLIGSKLQRDISSLTV